MNRALSRIAIGLACVCWSATAQAQTSVTTTVGSTSSPVTQPKPQPDFATKTLPEVDWQPTNTVPDILDHLHDQFPGVSFVLVRTPNTPENVPLGTRVQMKNATLEQLLNVLQLAHPGLSLSPVVPNGQGGPSLFPPSEQQQPPPPPSMWIAHLDDPQPTPEQKVQVFNLKDLVASRAADAAVDGGDHTHEATDEVLSVVNAALEAQAAGGPLPTLKVHEPTLTLIVRGTGAQLDLVQQTLATLNSDQGGTVRLYAKDWEDVTRKLKKLKELESKANETPVHVHTDAPTTRPGN